MKTQQSKRVAPSAALVPESHVSERTRTTATRQFSAAPDNAPAIPVWIALLIMSALATIYFLPAFIPGNHIFGTDYTSAGFFYQQFNAKQLLAGELPRWIPYVYGGVPSYANPGSTYYPTFLFGVFALPDTWRLAFLMLVQFVVGGIGMFLLTRELGARSWVALIAGLAFEFTGIVASEVFGGHDGRIIGTTFIPLCLYLIRRGVRTGTVGPFVGLSAALGCALLSFQIQNAYYLLLISTAWAVYCLFAMGMHRDVRALIRRIALGVGAVALAFGAAAILFLPFSSYVAESPRSESAGRGYEYATAFSMPPEEMVSLVVPEHYGTLTTYEGRSAFKDHTEYVGVFVGLFVLLGVPLFFRHRQRDPNDPVSPGFAPDIRGIWLFFASMAAFACTLSFGRFTPIYQLYYDFMPTINKFRAPSLAFATVVVCLVVLAALGLEQLASLDQQRRESWKRVTRVFVLWAVVIGVIGFVVSGPRGMGWVRFAVIFMLISLLLLGWMANRISAKVVMALLTIITVADLWIVDRQFFAVTREPELAYPADGPLKYLQAYAQDTRIWSFPYPAGMMYHGRDPFGKHTLPVPGYLMYYNFEEAGGEHSNPLQRWNEYVGAGDVSLVTWENLIQRPAFRDAANIGYIVGGYEIIQGDTGNDSMTTSLRLKYGNPSGFVYINETALPRSYVVPAVTQVAPGKALAEMKKRSWNPREMAYIESPLGINLPSTPLTWKTQTIYEGPNRAVIQTLTNRPGLLVLADSYANGWTVTVDGKPATMVRANHALRGVAVGAGTHTVVFSFAPQSLITGAWISLVCALLIIGTGAVAGILALRNRGRRHGVTPVFSSH